MAWIAFIIAGLLEAFGVAMINQLSKTRNWQTVVLLIVGFGLSPIKLFDCDSFLWGPLMRFGQGLALLAVHWLA